MSTATDSELMTEVRAERVGALGTLFERHHGKLYHFCLRMTGNRGVSEDLVQDVFMRMLKHRKSFQPNTAFMPWMYRIARNACKNRRFALQVRISGPTGRSGGRMRPPVVRMAAGQRAIMAHLFSP